jgi:hypothetical protein
VGPLTTIPAGDGTVGAITAVSTVEHGVDLGQFFGTASRLLRPGGLLCVSTDYWPTKIDVSDVTVFGLPWTIFDRDEARGLITHALDAGLTTADGSHDIPSAAEACIEFARRRYTFLGVVFRKT